MTFAIKLIFTNLLRMFLGKKMVLWALKLAASVSDTKVDDNMVLLVEGAYENDDTKVKQAVSELTKILSK